MRGPQEQEARVTGSHRFTAAAERQREDRLKAMARRTAARAAAATPAQGAAASDARIRSLMRDPRTWKDRDPGLLEHVTRQGARAYPGQSLHTGFQRLASRRRRGFQRA